MSNGTQRSRTVTSEMDGQIPSANSEQGEFFPLAMTLQVLAAAIVVFTVIPYLGIMTPPAGRTDLGWWRDGLIIDGAAGVEDIQKLQELGFVGVRLSYPHLSGPDITNQRLLKDIQTIGMKVIVTLAVDEDKQGQYSALQTTLEEWLSAGVDGISLSVSTPFSPASGVSLQNLTRLVQKGMWRHHVENSYDRKSLLIVESVDESTQVAALEGGADVVLGTSLCAPTSGKRTSELVERALTIVQERGDTQAQAWTVCESAQSDNLLTLLSLLLPGTPLSPASLPTKHLNEITEIRSWPALHWGTLETVIADDNVFSYLLWAKGRMYDKIVVVVNFGSQKVLKDYVIKLDKFTVPTRGRIILAEGDTTRKGEVVEMENLSVNGRELLVIQFPALGI